MVNLPAALHRYQYADYVALEEHNPARHEFVAGEIYAMAGGTPRHAALAAVVSFLIRGQLPAGCRTYSSDLRIRVDTADATVYPDGSVVRGKPVTAVGDALAVVNPTLVFEVTSDSTETWDRGGKRLLYESLPSVHEILLVAHREPRIEVWRRAANGEWITDSAITGQSLRLESCQALLTVDAIYADLGD